MDRWPWIKELSRKGVVRKISAVLRHQKAGYHARMLWSCGPFRLMLSRMQASCLRELPFISHCYERSPAQNKYNLLYDAACTMTSRPCSASCPINRRQRFSYSGKPAGIQKHLRSIFNEPHLENPFAAAGGVIAGGSNSPGCAPGNQLAVIRFL